MTNKRGRKIKELTGEERHCGFASRLRTLMALHRIPNNARLAENLNIASSVTINWINGGRIPTLENHWKALSKLFNVTTDHLLFGPNREKISEFSPVVRIPAQEITLKVVIQSGETTPPIGPKKQEDK